MVNEDMKIAKGKDENILKQIEKILPQERINSWCFWNGWKAIFKCLFKT